jgi:hypothetical protein
VAKKKAGAPRDVRAIRAAMRAFLDTHAANGTRIGGSTFGIYVFYDYDQEPIYVGQTYEGLSSRISRHLTNQRTDAVAMNVLDPFEVAEIQVWPFWEYLRFTKKRNKDEFDVAKLVLDAAEFTVFEQVLAESKFRAVLNEKRPRKMAKVRLPESYRGKIIPEELYEDRKHPDVRIARRASTIANLARVISERQVQPGLRNTLLVQARRLEDLARRRFADFGSQLPAKGAREEED